jgi:hypothetical protein
MEMNLLWVRGLPWPLLQSGGFRGRGSTRNSFCRAATAQVGAPGAVDEDGQSLAKRVRLGCGQVNYHMSGVFDYPGPKFCKELSNQGISREPSPVGTTRRHLLAFLAFLIRQWRRKQLRYSPKVNLRLWKPNH